MPYVPALENLAAFIRPMTCWSSRSCSSSPGDDTKAAGTEDPRPVVSGTTVGVPYLPVQLACSPGRRLDSLQAPAVDRRGSAARSPRVARPPGRPLARSLAAALSLDEAPTRSQSPPPTTCWSTPITQRPTSPNLTFRCPPPQHKHLFFSADTHLSQPAPPRPCLFSARRSPNPRCIAQASFTTGLFDPAPPPASTRSLADQAPFLDDLHSLRNPVNLLRLAACPPPWSWLQRRRRSVLDRPPFPHLPEA